MLIMSSFLVILAFVALFIIYKTFSDTSLYPTK